MLISVNRTPVIKLSVRLLVGLKCICEVAIGALLRVELGMGSRLRAFRPGHATGQAGRAIWAAATLPPAAAERLDDVR